MLKNLIYISIFTVGILNSTIVIAANGVPPLGDSKLLTGTPEGFEKSCHADIAQAKAKLDELKATKAHRNTLATLDLFDVAMLHAGNAASRSGLAQQVQPDKAFREAAEKCEQEASAFLTEASLDRGIYDVLSSLDTSKLSGADAHFVETTLRDYRRAGVDRDEATRAKIKKLRDELTVIGQDFARNIAEDRHELEFDPADLNGLPEDFKHSHKVNDKGKVVLTSDNTDYVPFMKYARSEKARERFFRSYLQRAYPKNIDVLQQLMQKRYELAKTLGYKDWAAYITEDKMITSEKNAAEFIDKITDAAKTRSDREYADLLAAKQQEDPNAKDFQAWDYQYLLNKVKAAKFDFDPQISRPYFEYSRVKKGVMDISARMYGITYKPVKDAKVWHPDVEAYDVYDKSTLLGRIYFDMFPRENKYKHYATFTIATGREGTQLPESVLVCNFPQGSGSDPGLMEYGDVTTFFHEYGHLLHQIFGGHTRWASGNLEWDFIEAPSQMFEEWTHDPAMLQSFARDYKTDQPLPVELARKLRAADEYGKGLNVRQQMFYAALSLNLYNRDPKNVDSTKELIELQKRYSPFKYVDGTYMQTSFGHLEGYSAIYYTYMWSLVIAKDMFTVFKGKGLMDSEAAQRYRTDVLAAGASKPAGDLVKDFLGRPYSFDAYKKWLDAD